MFTFIVSAVVAMYHFVAGVPGFLLGHATAASFVVAFATVGLGLLAYDRIIRPRIAGRPVDPLRRQVEWGAYGADPGRAARIAADDEAWGTWHGPRKVWLPGTTTIATVDERTAALVVDPTLKAAEVAEMVDHVAPGAGSVASVAAAVIDTRLRTSEMQAEIAAAELDAYDEEEQRAERRFFAVFNLRLDRALQRFDAATGRADTWWAYEHGQHEHECPVCRAMAEISGEYRQILGEEDTRAMDLRELHRELAAAA